MLGLRGMVGDLVKSVGLYLAFIVGGVVSFLSLAPVFGYAPYGDRPGTGWYGRFPATTWHRFWDGILFLSGWATLLVLYAAAAAIVLYGVTRLLERLRLSRVAVAIVAAVLSGILSGGVVAGIGWYIAIAGPAVDFAVALGIIYGGWLLPKTRR
jgi:hypothetical protein